jgi:hypothetical protein
VDAAEHCDVPLPLLLRVAAAVLILQRVLHLVAAFGVGASVFVLRAVGGR